MGEEGVAEEDGRMGTVRPIGGVAPVSGVGPVEDVIVHQGGKVD